MPRENCGVLKLSIGSLKTNMEMITFALGIIIGLLIGILEARSIKKHHKGVINKLAEPILNGKKQMARFIEPRGETDMESIINKAFQNK